MNYLLNMWSMNKQNKQRLKDLELATLKAKYPTIEERFIPLTSWTDNSANALTKCIVSFINMSGGYAERINTMGTYKQAKTVKDVDGITRTVGKGKYIPSGSTKGSADISATIKGRAVKIEIKYGKDRMSEAQKEYQQNTERAGGIYYIARDFDSFIEWYDKLISEL
jgi:hypothetical protein